MAVVALPAGNSSGEGGHGSGGLGGYVASCGVCVFYGTGLFGAGDCGFGDERVKGEWRVLCCAGRWIVWNLDFGEWGYGLGGWGVDSGVLVFWGSGYGLGGWKCNSKVCNF